MGGFQVERAHDLVASMSRGSPLPGWFVEEIRQGEGHGIGVERGATGGVGPLRTQRGGEWDTPAGWTLLRDAKLVALAAERAEARRLTGPSQLDPRQLFEDEAAAEAAAAALATTSDRIGSGSGAEGVGRPGTEGAAATAACFPKGAAGLRARLAVLQGYNRVVGAVLPLLDCRRWRDCASGCDTGTRPPRVYVVA
eukprot:1188684-Prorocentrum_minimum.AAC.2